MFNCTGKVFEVLSWKEDSSASRWLANELVEPTSLASEKKEIAVDV